jgi:hypothetical protein
MTCLASRLPAALLVGKVPARLRRAVAAIGRAFVLWQLPRAVALLAQIDRDKAEQLGLRRRELRAGVAWMLRERRRS